MASLVALTLEVRNLELAEEFYRRLFGFRVQERAEALGCLHLQVNDRQILRLWRPTTNLHSAGLPGLEELRLRGGAHVHYAWKIPWGTGEQARKILESLSIPYETHSFGPQDLAIYFYDPDLHGLELRESRLFSASAVDPEDIISARAFKEVVLEFEDLSAASKRIAEVYGFPYLWGGMRPRAFLAYRLGDNPEVGEAVDVEGADLFIWDPQTGIADMQGGEHVYLTLGVGESELYGLRQRVHAAGLRVLETSRSLFVRDPERHCFEFRLEA